MSYFSFLSSYSCDEGATWNQLTFSDERIYVVRMLTERGEKAQHATIFGYTGYPDPFEWLIIDLDFETLQLEQCNDTDYYQWSPTDEVSTCINHHSVTVVSLSLFYSVLASSVYSVNSMCLNDDYQTIAAPLTMIMTDQLINAHVLVLVKIMNGNSSFYSLFNY